MHPTPEKLAQDDYALLIDVLPEWIRARVEPLPSAEVLEIVLDLGRSAEVRLANQAVPLGDRLVDDEDLQHVLSRVGDVGQDNRAGIERTLHRVSAIRNRSGRVVGLTLRVGRALFGTIEVLRDLVESGRNILLLGRPGVGKTTKLREIARVLADDFGRRVMVVDTSNEIGGDGDVPHPAIGAARRMQVSRPDRQHDVMIEAVENHMPQAIIVDEIGTEAEALAARTIAERGVQLIATAHGNTLDNLVLNPTLSDLVGGVQTVTLSDEEAHRRRTQKTVSERRAPPTFDIVVQMVDRDEVLIHRDTADAVDRLLAGKPIPGERRRHQEGGPPQVEQVERAPPPRPAAPPPLEDERSADTAPGGKKRVYLHALSKELFERVLRDVDVSLRQVRQPESADVILALKSRAKDPRVRKALERTGAQLFLARRNSSAELRRVLKLAFPSAHGYEDEEVRETLEEAEHAVKQVLEDEIPIHLGPRPPTLRKLQHQLVKRHRLEARSEGSEPVRHLVIYPPGAFAREEYDA